jgi:DNA mismatch endonuclease, patch repair protein
VADRISPQKRSANMARVKNKNTKPEIEVRKILHRLGYRFRLHGQNLPGNPDIVLPRHRKVIFVHGCFWHSHNCPRGRRPLTSVDFWNDKLDRNLTRDAARQQDLRASGWAVLVVWECMLKDLDVVEKMLVAFMQEVSISGAISDEHREND